MDVLVSNSPSAFYRPSSSVRERNILSEFAIFLNDDSIVDSIEIPCVPPMSLFFADWATTIQIRSKERQER